MKLGELLYAISDGDDKVGIWDISLPIRTWKRSTHPFEDRPTPQKYIKIKNLRYKHFRYYLGYDVYSICHTEAGFLITIGNKQEVHDRAAGRELAAEIASAMERIIG